MPPAEIESAPSPPEGDALSAELWGRIEFILAVNSAQRKPSALEKHAKIW